MILIDRLRAALAEALEAAERVRANANRQEGMVNDIIERLRDRERLSLEGVRPLVQACEAAANEITRLRAALAEAEQGSELVSRQLMKSCERINDLEATLAEAERETKRLTELLKERFEYLARAMRAEAELAEAREVIAKSVQLYESYGLLAQHKDCGYWVNDARAFLERSAPDAEKAAERVRASANQTG